MSRWSPLVILPVTSLLCLVPSLGPVPAGRFAASAPRDASRSSIPAAPAVRIQHELITVPAAPARPRPAIRTARFRSAQAPPRPGAGTTITARARRMLLGDGTHRPEPFPRLTRD